MRWREAFGQGSCRCLGGFLRSRFEKGFAELTQPFVLRFARAWSSIQKMMLFQQNGEKRSRLIRFGNMLRRLGLDTITNRLTQERMGLLFANEVQKVPGSIRENDTVNFSVILDGTEQVVECRLGSELGDRGKASLGFGDIFIPDGLKKKFSRWTALDCRRRKDRMQDLVLATALFLNTIGITVKDFEYRQRLQRRRQLLGHVKRRRQSHHGMKTDVIFAAEGAGIGQSARRYELAKLRAGPQFSSEAWQQFVHRRLLHETDEGFEGSEVQQIRRIRAESTRKSEFGGYAMANADNQHAAANFSKEFTTSTRNNHKSSRC